MADTSGGISYPTVGTDPALIRVTLQDMANDVQRELDKKSNAADVAAADAARKAHTRAQMQTVDLTGLQSSAWTAKGAGLNVHPNLTVKVTIGGVFSLSPNFAESGAVRLGFQAVNGEGVRYAMHDLRSITCLGGMTERSWIIDTTRTDQSAWLIQLAVRSTALQVISDAWLIVEGWQK